MGTPLAPGGFELILLASTGGTIAIWALLVRGVFRRGRRLWATFALALVAVLPVAGPVVVAAVLHSTEKGAAPVRG